MLKHKNKNTVKSNNKTDKQTTDKKQN